MDIDELQGGLDGNGLSVGIAQARFNEPLCEALREACLAELERLGVAAEDVVLVTVPGALELPIALQQLARQQQFDALIALGAVVRGETYHFEVVSNESAAGIARVSLDHDIPIANAVLTTNDDEQALARVQTKGAEAARVAVEMANLAELIDDLSDVMSDDDVDE
ncbi:MAG: 6,7-dimethyl-8-ribityllumazine synthase [Burkholderiaceae bacterium]